MKATTHLFHYDSGHTDARRGNFSSQSSSLPPQGVSGTGAEGTWTATYPGRRQSCWSLLRAVTSCLHHSLQQFSHNHTRHSHQRKTSKTVCSDSREPTVADYQLPQLPSPCQQPSPLQLSPRFKSHLEHQVRSEALPGFPITPSVWGPQFMVTSPQLTGPLHAFVNHLAEVQGLVCKLRPSSVQDNFKDCSHQPARRLRKDEAFLCEVSTVPCLPTRVNYLKLRCNYPHQLKDKVPRGLGS